jgi:LPS sulfotransferase NodH
MTHSFDYFVVLAGMRTGSNLLEEQLAAMPGIVSHGELFNPHFFGKPEVKTQWGLSMAARDSDPVRVIGAMQKAAPGLHGFRLFYDHDARAIDLVLRDPKAAKIILTRRPIDSYVSLKIARKTGQWWLGDMTSARAAKVPFDAEEYTDFLNDLNDFQNQITHTLQITGQTAFHIAYEDLSDDDVLSGLGTFLGAEGPPDPSKVKAKVQNPTPVKDRLTNARVAEEALRSLTAPDLGRAQIYEPYRGPGLRFFRVCQSAPLLYMPIRGAGFDPIPDWLVAADPNGEVETGMTQKDLRRWKRQHSGHRSFSVLRHPLPRVYDAFCRFVLPTDQENYADVRALLTNRYDLALPASWPAEDWDMDKHRAAFLGFLKFLSGNLGGQTAVRVDNTWATQAVLLHAIAQFAVPDRLIREDNLSDELERLAGELNVDAPDFSGHFNVTDPYPLAEVITQDIQNAAATAYRRDYVMFGFNDWCADQAA